MIESVPPKTRARTNVHDIGSTFFGRSGEIAALGQRLREGVRLLTVSGPGGMGKTRLALRFASTQVDTFAADGGGGAWFCALNEARSALDIAAGVAAALGIGGDAGRHEGHHEPGLVDEVGAALARRGPTLLVLDNFEHLVAHAAETVGAWMTRATWVRFVVTSRIALRLPGEELRSLEPLPSELAFALFVQRARQLRPELALADTDLAAIREIVALLGGMPLAIELAAPRMTVLSARELLGRLRGSLDLLVRSGDGSRHASMRGTILESVRLLGAEERAVFAGCATFRGSFSVAAAEAVLPDADVVTRLEALVSHSLLRAVPAPQLGSEMRFSFFETLREAAEEALALDPTRDELADRHARFYATLAGQLTPRPGASLEPNGASRLDLDLDNLLAAHAGLIARGQAREALVIVLGIEPIVRARGLMRLSLQLLDEGIAAATSTAGIITDGQLAEALLARGLAHRELGLVDRARDDLHRGLALAERGGDDALAALAHLRLGEIIEVSGATLEARSRFAQALQLLARAPFDAATELRQAETYLRLGHAFRREGELARAEGAVEEAIARFRRLGHDAGFAGAFYELAVVAMFQGRRDRALHLFGEGLVMADRAGARSIFAMLTTARGCVLQELGRLDEALVHHADGAQIFAEIGARYREMSALYYLSTAYFEKGAASEAETFLAQAAERSRGVEAPRYIALIEGCRAIVLASAGRQAGAKEALARADAAATACATEPALTATLSIHHLTVAASAGASVDVGAAEAEARAHADAHPSDDSGFALRAFLAIVHPEPKRAPTALTIFGEGHAFRLPGASERVDLSHRPPLCAILQLLARQRLAAPRETVPLEDIVRAGWPDEKVRLDAATNRARVALATLRKLGLRDLIVTGPGGYMISPAVVIQFAEPHERGGQSPDFE